jgi:hypothetical protein
VLHGAFRPRQDVSGHDTGKDIVRATQGARHGSFPLSGASNRSACATGYRRAGRIALFQDFPKKLFSYIIAKEMELQMPSFKSAPKAKLDKAAVLTKAVLRAASQLGLTNKVLATVIGLSEATISRMRAGEYELQPGHKPFELAVLFVRLYRSLDAIVGGDDEVAATWLKNRNIVLDDAPLALMQTVPGLMNVIQYLDARRAVL